MKRYLRMFIAFIIMMFAQVDEVHAGTCSSSNPIIGYFGSTPSYSDGATYSGDCQCVEFVVRASGVARLTATSGAGANKAYSAYDYLPTVDSNYTVNDNDGLVAPAYGDIMVWNGDDGVGHVGMVNRGYDGSSTIQIVDENRTTGSGATDGYMDCDISVSGSGGAATYSVDCSRYLSSRSYTLRGWLHDTSDDCTDVTYSYGINLIAIATNTSDYTLNGYVVSGTGESATLENVGALQSNTGQTSTHKFWLVGNVDGDDDGGFDDVVEITDNGSNAYAQVYLSDGVGGLEPRDRWATTSTGVLKAFLEDTDDDGDADLIVGYKKSDNVTMKWNVLTSNRAGFDTAAAWSSSFGKKTDTFVVGDFNNNGKAELMCGTPADGSTTPNFTSYLSWKRLASGGSTSTVSSSYGYSGDVYFAADMNNNGYDELVRVNLANSTVGVYDNPYSTSSSAFSGATKIATDVGGTDGTYFFYYFDPSDDYPDLLRVNSSGSLYYGRNTSGTSVEEQSNESEILSGMSLTTSYLFGDFGEYSETFCE